MVGETKNSRKSFDEKIGGFASEGGHFFFCPLGEFEKKDEKEPRGETGEKERESEFQVTTDGKCQTKKP